ncbi:MAG: segregation/condensation protein A, partial [Clostridia bacterium]|nr:segregation/condensation protein A [Clostridia bacterium]
MENERENLLQTSEIVNSEEAFDASSFRVKLNSFEGPLDLLLELIKTAKIDICQIFLSEITEQYLEIVSDISNLDVEKASDFIDMAATLLEIKSKKLLPKPEEEVLDEEDPEQKLIRQIEEYKIIKEASEKLQLIEDVNKFYKKPDNSAGDFRYVLPEKLDIDNLIEAFSKIMFKAQMKAEVPKEKKIEKDRFTVAQKIGQIKDVLLTKKKFKFSELFEADYSKSEIINTFLALLEL